MSDETLAYVNRVMNQIIQSDPELAGIFGRREPSYRFWRLGNRRFCFTTEKLEHKGKQRYLAFIEKDIKSKHQVRRLKRVGFAKKYKARDRAYSWYLKYKEKKEQAMQPAQISV